MKKHEFQVAVCFFSTILLSTCTRQNTFAQTYQVGVPVCDTTGTGITTYSYLQGDCGPTDHLTFRFSNTLVPYVTGLSFQLVITAINGRIWSNSSDTVEVGEILPLPAIANTGVLTIYMALPSSFSFIMRITGTPTVAYERYYCEIRQAFTTAICGNDVEYFGEGQICQVQPAAAVEEQGDASIPIQFQLLQNYPNPFNATTIIQFDLTHSSEVSLQILNLNGEEIATLLHQKQLAAGSHTINWNAENFPSGIYVYRLRSEGSYIAMKKLVLLK